ncbi:hypothetical protein D5272_08460 [bacterium D16-76]|nr:hypothetical protein [bacterium D16-76]
MAYRPCRPFHHRAAPEKAAGGVQGPVAPGRFLGQRPKWGLGQAPRSCRRGRPLPPEAQNASAGFGVNPQGLLKIRKEAEKRQKRGRKEAEKRQKRGRKEEKPWPQKKKTFP